MVVINRTRTIAIIAIARNCTSANPLEANFAISIIGRLAYLRINFWTQQRQGHKPQQIKLLSYVLGVFSDWLGGSAQRRSFLKNATGGREFGEFGPSPSRL